MLYLHHEKNQNAFSDSCHNNLIIFQILEYYLNWYFQWLNLLHYLYADVKEMLQMFLLIEVSLTSMLHFLLKGKLMHVAFSISHFLLKQQQAFYLKSTLLMLNFHIINAFCFLDLLLQFQVYHLILFLWFVIILMQQQCCHNAELMSLH